MAKYGEGDKRWIVEDRSDGTNVHNWHWSERDCLEWSRSLLQSLLQNVPLLSGEGGLSASTTTLDKVTGEAYVNVRKGKVIPGYELALSLSWEGLAADVKVRGTLEIPYLADENAGEDPELRITVRDDEGPVGRRMRDAIAVKGKPVILEKIREYVQSMARGGPAKDELEAKKPKSRADSNTPNSVPAVASSAVTAAVVREKKEKRKEGFKTVAMQERFYCRSKDLYEILMDERRWKGFTQSNAAISREVGGRFSIFDGSVTGENVELQEGKLIVQKWRFGSWVDGLYSTVRLEFDEPEPGITVVNLKQTDVPEEDRYGNSTVVENTERGWRDLIFNRIKSVFGFGI